jgi:hypothetical protein
MNSRSSSEDYCIELLTVASSEEWEWHYYVALLPVTFNRGSPVPQRNVAVPVDMGDCHVWGAPGIEWVEARDAAQCLYCPGRPQRKTCLAHTVSRETLSPTFLMRICPFGKNNLNEEGVACDKEL